MFLELVKKRNKELIEISLELHKNGKIDPDTYIIDVDRTVENAKMIKEEADKYGISLYYMTKQIGRNPYIGKKLDALGYKGAVAVDYKEAKVLSSGGARIGHVGHLVQVPDNLVGEVIDMNPEVITIYSVEKARKIDEEGRKRDKIQGILLKVYEEGDMLYPGQYSGFNLEDLKEVVDEIKKLKNVRIDGLTHFPCFLLDSESNELVTTKNIETVKKGKVILEELGVEVRQVNTPSTTIVENMKNIYDNGGNYGEPGHGLTGTTPYNKYHLDSKEIPSMIYLSEISHNFKGRSYIYGGGHYRRSHLEDGLTGKNIDRLKKIEITPPSDESIDYYFEGEEGVVGDPVVMSFRTQIFVTRSDVALVEGLSEGKGRLVGVYDSQGRRLR